MNDRTTSVLVFLTFLLVVGLWVVLYLAYQKYQQYAATLQSDTSSVTGALSSASGLLATLFPQKSGS